MKYLPLLTSVLCISVLPVLAQEKKKVTKADDLPRLTYKVDGTATALITDAAKFDPFAQKVRADIEKILAEYDITDKTTLKDFKGTLLALEMLAGHDDATLALIRELRELEDKPSAKLLTGLSTEARIEARKATGGAKLTDPAFKKTFQKTYAAKLAALPWDVVQADLKQNKGRVEIASENLFIGSIQSHIEPALKETGTVSSEIAQSLIGIRKTMQLDLPLKNQVVAALDSVIAAHDVKKPDIWKAREWKLSPGDKAQPVVVAVWDSGVDTAIFKDGQFTNAKEQMNGKDDDGNGYIDDVHGIAYDLESNKDASQMYPLKGAQERLPSMKNNIKGMLDLQAAIDSPEATALKKTMSAIKPEEVKPFMEDLSLFGNYSHGTHVAGIAAAGNPFARVLSARMTYDHRAIPLAPTVELAKKEAKMYRETVDYFKANNVRVVNMSWGGSQKDVEAALEANGIEKDAAKRAELARTIFKISRDGLYEALKSAPEILFVCAAGNSDNDSEFEELIPSSFRLPNMITVGAVDQAGDRTSFTTFGKNVEVYANGFEVDSYIPGGDRMKFSGTSMASPNVANLAAKIIAVKPSLKPQEVAALIKETSEKGGSEKFPLINPKKTAGALK
ncbi:MAG TPA: S8 family serine peptidase [Verrucomicrobiales bacterium]|nr:S8 family serine peptidase [Verrucomicrobiales bacterium]